MDEFVLEYTLHQHKTIIDAHKKIFDDHVLANDQAMAAMDGRVDDLEASELEINGSINSLKGQVENLQAFTQDLLRELNKTKLVNIKQDLVIRTLNNLTQFDAYDMFTDTFIDGTNVDWKNSIRAELLTEFQAIGKTNKATVVLEQTVVSNYQLISKNGSSDEAVAQTFILDKTRDVDKLTLNLGLFNTSVFQPIIVSIYDSLYGSPLTQTVISPGQLSTVSQWMEIDLPDITLVANQEYIIRLQTDDPHGYKIGFDLNDNYLAGTSFSLFNNVWTDSNYDIGFKVWCFPAVDETDATILTLPRTLASVPESIIFDCEEVNIEGGINYYISRDGGTNWKILQPGFSTDLNDLPIGQELIIKAYIMKNSRINAWGYVVTRSDTV